VSIEQHACARKKAYPTRSAAARGVRYAQAHHVWHAEVLVPYLCHFCRNWHNGSIDPTDRARYKEGFRISARQRRASRESQ
jgi:hypothetical protein